MTAATLLLLLFFTQAGTETKLEAWTLATADTEIRVGVPGNRLVVSRLAAKGQPHNWAKLPMVVPLMAKVWVDGHEVSTAWTFKRGTVDQEQGSLSLLFTNAEPKMELRSVWRARSGRGPVEHWIEIENTSSDRLCMGHQDSLSLHRLSAGGETTLWWIKRGGGNASTQGGTFTEPFCAELDLVLTSNCEDGASPVPWMAVQVGRERGLYVGWEFSGLGRIHAKAGNPPDELSLDVGNHPDFKTEIAPGETFFVPPALVGCYLGDVDDGSYSLHRFVVEKLRPATPEPCPDPILAYNLYLDAGGSNAREDDVLRSARFCHDLGFEVFMPDAMWFPETGDWRWDPQRFPGGIEPIEAFVHGEGMKLALWCAWTNGGLSADPGALSVRGPVGRPEWFHADYGPEWKPGPFFGGRICLGCPEAKQWALEKTQWLVAHHKLDYLKHDISPIVTHCNKSTHRHRDATDASYWATQGYYEVQEKLREAFPNLILENCSGGGHIKDFGVVGRTHYTVTTDTLSNLPNRQSIYDSTFALPPILLQAYTYDNYYPVKGDEPNSFLWRSAMMGAWQIDPTDTGKWTEPQRESARRSVEIYKEWIRPMLRDVKVHHVLPRPDGVRWDGMFYFSPRLRRGTLYIWRPQSPDARQTVRLKGLAPETKYWLWCEDGSIAPDVLSGRELMERGLTIELPEPYTSDLVFLRDEALGKPDGLDAPREFRLETVAATAGTFAASARLSWTESANARSYRVVVSDRPDFAAPLVTVNTARRSLSLDDLPAERSLYWKVEAISWGGKQENWGGSETFTTPPPNRPAGITFLSDMPWAEAVAGADNPVRRDENYYGKRISIAGKDYPKGLWTHAFPDDRPADIVMDVSGKGFATFATTVGLDDQSGGGSVQFQVLVDGALKAESPVMRPRAVHAFRVDVRGARQVTLRVLNAGDGYSCDHAAWGLTRFVETGVDDPF